MNWKNITQDSFTALGVFSFLVINGLFIDYLEYYFNGTERIITFQTMYGPIDSFLMLPIAGISFLFLVVIVLAIAIAIPVIIYCIIPRSTRRKIRKRYFRQ